MRKAYENLLNTFSFLICRSEMNTQVKIRALSDWNNFLRSFHARLYEVAVEHNNNEFFNQTCTWRRHSRFFLHRRFIHRFSRSEFNIFSSGTNTSDKFLFFSDWITFFLLFFCVTNTPSARLAVSQLLILLDRNSWGFLAQDPSSIEDFLLHTLWTQIWVCSRLLSRLISQWVYASWRSSISA